MCFHLHEQNNLVDFFGLKAKFSSLPLFYDLHSTNVFETQTVLALQQDYVMSATVYLLSPVRYLWHIQLLQVVL